MWCKFPLTTPGRGRIVAVRSAEVRSTREHPATRSDGPQEQHVEGHAAGRITPPTLDRIDAPDMPGHAPHDGGPAHDSTPGSGVFDGFAWQLT